LLDRQLELTAEKGVSQAAPDAEPEEEVPAEKFFGVRPAADT
jgi:hypothetical protein